MLHREKVQVRPAEAQDAEAICRIRVLAWQAAYCKLMPESYLRALNPLENIESWRERIERPVASTSIGVAEVGGSVVGFFTAGLPRYPTGEKCFELRALNVHPDYWRQGIGCALISRALDISLLQGFERVELWCISGNIPARATYEHCGFSLIGHERSSTALTGQLLCEVLYAKALRSSDNRIVERSPI